MHLELKDTVTKLMTGDLKKKLIDGVWSSLGALYNTATGLFYKLLVAHSILVQLCQKKKERKYFFNSLSCVLCFLKICP